MVARWTNIEMESEFVGLTGKEFVDVMDDVGTD